MSALAKQDEHHEVQTHEGNTLLDRIMQAASNPDMDIDKFERLIGMQERMAKSEAERQFNEALATAQSEMAPIARDAANAQTNSKYSKLETIQSAIKPVISKHGFSLSFGQGETQIEGHYRVICTLRHNGGHKETYQMDVPSDGIGIKGNRNKTETHAFGSSMSYGRRYLTLSIFDLTTLDDDDGQAAGAKPISDEQRDMLQQLIDETSTDIAAFCKSMKIGALAQLPSAKFGTAQQLLMMKKKRQEADNG